MIYHVVPMYGMVPTNNTRVITLVFMMILVDVIIMIHV